jgi:hypothetical protein
MEDVRGASVVCYGIVLASMLGIVALIWIGATQ